MLTELKALEQETIVCCGSPASLRLHSLSSKGATVSSYDIRIHPTHLTQQIHETSVESRKGSEGSAAQDQSDTTQSAREISDASPRSITSFHLSLSKAIRWGRTDQRAPHQGEKVTCSIFFAKEHQLAVESPDNRAQAISSRSFM